jgi:hypothetical protein
MRRVRWLARARSFGLATAVAILSLAGLRAAIAGPPTATERLAGRGVYDIEAAAFAERFARASFTWDLARPELRERALAPLVSASLDAGAGLEPDDGAYRWQRCPTDGIACADGARQAVRWTAVVAERRSGRRRRSVTVAAETTRGLYYLAVPVARDERGFMFVPAYPALVGPPPAAPEATAEEEPEVEDAQLRVVAERAVRNYLGRQSSDLNADLAPEAVVSLPTRALRVEDVEAVRELAGSRVAVEVRAARGGVSWRLRYELVVVRRERWYVRSIQSTSEGRQQ